VTATPASSQGGSHVLSIWSKLQPEREVQHGGLIPSDQTCGPRAACREAMKHNRHPMGAVKQNSDQFELQ
jgi:hypothetical protein